MPWSGTLLTYAPYNISGVHFTPVWATGAVRAASGAYESQRGPGRVGVPEDNIRLDRATPWLQGEGLGRDAATGHFVYLLLSRFQYHFGEPSFSHWLASDDAVPNPEILQVADMLFWFQVLISEHLFQSGIMQVLQRLTKAPHEY